MIAYHIDRSGKLQEEQIISFSNYSSDISTQLFDGKVSEHGKRYLTECFAPDLVPFIIEYEFELIRQSSFPERFSRYQSFFALESIEDLIYWPELFKPEFKIYEIEFHHNNVQKLDASFLKGGPDLNFNLHWDPNWTFNAAMQYWNGQTSEKPKPELLILPPVTVKTEKRLSIGLT